MHGGTHELVFLKNLTAQKLYALWDYDGAEGSPETPEEDATLQTPTAPLLPPSGFVSGFASHLNAEETQHKVDEL